MTPEQSANILARMFGYQGPTDQRSIDQFLAANPAAASRMGKYQETMKQMVSGQPIRGFNQGGLSAEHAAIIDRIKQLESSGIPVTQENLSLVTGKPSGSTTTQTSTPQKDYTAAQSTADKAKAALDEANKLAASGQSVPQETLNNIQTLLDQAKSEATNAPAAPSTAQTSTQTNTQTSGDLARLQAGQQALAQQASQPIKPAEVAKIDSSAGQISTGVGQAGAAPTFTPTQVADVQQVVAPEAAPAQTITPVTAATEVAAETAALQPEQTVMTPQSIIEAAQQTGTAVSSLEAAQGTGILMNNPVQREIQDGELISGAVADAEKAAAFTGQIEAATATPSKQATVQGQLEDLMAQFESGQPPAWAAGAMRAANAMLVSRGLGASSIAGQAVIQATMEAALPIAMADAQTQAQFESQNLSNRQQRAMLAAQQRAAFIGQEFDQAFQARVLNASKVSDIANLNFTAEQQVALENSRIVNTVNLQNLTNRQATVMAEAAALSNLEMANLNNRQQTAVQNAQNFLQVDLTNLSNRQQTALFKTQANIQALFTDQAAQNAAMQFNASSQNQVDQFYKSLSAQTSQFNASQTNAIAQFNTGQSNAVAQFNAELTQQRNLFNSQNALIIEQANAQWRQNVATLNTAAQNAANMEQAKTLNALSGASLAQTWQRERDLMSYAFTAQQSALDRELSILLGDKEMAAAREALQSKEDTYKYATLFDWLLD